MRLVALILMLPACSALAGAQNDGQAAQGVSSAWDAREMLAALSAQAQRLGPLLERMQTERWTQSGAPAAYEQQRQSGKVQLDYLLHATQELSERPERLTVALGTLFQLQSLEVVLGTLREGARKYQDGSLADEVQTVFVENANNREKLRTYVQEVAAAQEERLAVMDREAQRCRESLVDQPLAPARRRGKRQ